MNKISSIVHVLCYNNMVQVGLMQVLLCFLLVPCCQVAAAAALQSISTTTSVANVAVHRVPLYRSNTIDNNNQDSSLLKSAPSSSSSPYCFAVSNPMTTLPNSNFLATQVWPSARVAAMTLERYIMMSSSCNNEDDDVVKLASLTICEFGCGPGLPSLTAAVISNQQRRGDKNKKPVAVVSKVYATDVDLFALKLVQAAAKEQSVTDIIGTRQLDLTTTTMTRNNDQLVPDADLYLFSDVFESSAVARGAARITCQVLFKKNGKYSTVWVFCQSDRAQRQVYIQEMQRLLADRRNANRDDDDHVVDIDDFNTIQQSLSWQDHGDWPSISTTRTKRLWLCNVDETKVRYG